MLDAHTLAFRPRGLGFPLGTHVQHRAAARRAHRRAASRSVAHAHDRLGGAARLDAAPAAAARRSSATCPLDWHAGRRPGPPRRARRSSPPRVDPPRRALHLALPEHAAASCQRCGSAGRLERDHARRRDDVPARRTTSTVDAIAGPVFWHALIADAVAGKRRDDGYSYVFVHRNVPQSLNLWHNGQVILTSPGNTGVPAAPTELGTFPVFEHIPVGTMSGHEPGRLALQRPGHPLDQLLPPRRGASTRSTARSFGTPQSLGCVELPLDAAAKVWPYTPIGTLVTIEN